jgi:hypothetical protein
MEQALTVVDLEYPVGVAGSAEDVKVSSKVVTAAIKAISDVIVSALSSGKQK